LLEIFDEIGFSEIIFQSSGQFHSYFYLRSEQSSSFSLSVGFCSQNEKVLTFPTSQDGLMDLFLCDKRKHIDDNGKFEFIKLLTLNYHHPIMKMFRKKMGK
jgi:hypothetical protein